MKKALVLSGGGARGAYHIGVMEALVETGWMQDGHGPDILAGTSIGAINAAALASGHTVDRLRKLWLDMHTEDVHRLSGDIPPLVRPLLRFLLRSVLTSQAHGGAADYDLLPHERTQTTVRFLRRLGELFRVRPFRGLLDTAPWRRTLASWMDFDRINSPAAPALLVAATEVQSGALEVFCNRPLQGRPAQTLTLDHILASASIPIIYPWTTIGARKYWDGAVVANTPLEPVIDLAGDDDLDIIVVMMTPWSPSADHASTTVPQDLAQAMTLTLDWALLGSYRVAFAALEQRNRLARAIACLRAAGIEPPPGPIPRPIAMPTVIAPQTPMPLDWILDYEHVNHYYLFAQGRADALRVLNARKESGEEARELPYLR